MSFSLAAGTYGSYDATAPGGIVQVPLPRNYPIPGFKGLTPENIGPLGGDTAPPPDGLGDGAVMRVTPGGATVLDPGATGGAIAPAPDASGAAATPGWFFDWPSLKFKYRNADGTLSDTAPNAQGQQVPGLGGALNPLVGSSGVALGWIEELAIRAMMILVGLVFIFGGFYVAGQRSRRSPVVVASPFATTRNAVRNLAT